MPTFHDALAFETDADGTLHGEIQEDWRQGRAAYGGLMGALALKAMQSRVDADRPTRVLQVVFVAPLGQGPLRVESTLLREGRSMTLAEARILQEDRVLLTASAALGADRDSDILVPAQTPEPIKEPAACIEQPYMPGITPAFTQHFKYRWAEGNFPFMGAKEAGFKGWCRHGATVADAAQAIVGLADAWPAPSLSMARGPVPASSVTWNLQFTHLPQEIDPQAWWRMDYQADHAAAGMHTITGQLYAPDGTLAAISTQLAVVFDKR